ncbi:MAG: hypothetical protein K8S56_03970 [Candidatus Cloacimonetes bacterium]|nr:hypothetical protein [Candidatus Cloacimonadota bacterium]
MRTRFAYLLILLGCISVLIFSVSCDVIFGYPHMSKIRVEDDVVLANYTNEDMGAANTTQFMLDEVYNLAYRYHKCKTLMMDMYIIKKTGDAVYLGNFIFDDLEFARSCDNKQEWYDASRKQRIRYRKLFNTAFPRKSY